MRQYKYYHITVQPKGCDGTNRNDDYLSNTLVSKLDTQLLLYSKHFARAIEKNTDKVGHHYHYAIELHNKMEREKLKDIVMQIVREQYDLSEQGEQRVVRVVQKTLKAFKLVAYGYCTKQFETIEGNPNYISKMPDEDITPYIEEYQQLVETKKKTDFQEWVLDTEKKPTAIRNISRYYEVLNIVIERENTENINEFNFHKLLYMHIVTKYKITYEYSSISKFHRQVLEYLYMYGYLTNTGSETLVNFTRFKKLVETDTINTETGNKTITLREYFDIS
jgi:hypothetical protein